MTVLTMLKFWKSNYSKVATATTTASDGDSAETVADSTISGHLTDYSDDDDDSFFELELTLPSCSKDSSENFYNCEDEKESQPKMMKSKPQSPISILRSASPKLGVLIFGKFNKKQTKRVDEMFEMESVSSCCSPKRNNSSLFTVNFRIEDGSIVPKFTRSGSNNSSVSASPKIEKQSSNNTYTETSKRFSKDVVQKYLNLIKPKPSKKITDGEKFVASPTRPSITSPFLSMKKEEKHSSRFKVKAKQFGKCKSSSAIIVPSAVNFPARNDNPCDGIEGAILHCKRSLTSSKGYSSLSRCSSDPSHEKSIQVSEKI